MHNQILAKDCSAEVTLFACVCLCGLYRYARKHFSSPEESQYADIQHCMGLLAFPCDCNIAPYKVHFTTTIIHYTPPVA